MATIKLQPSGKVVLKDGKVSCGCCCGCRAISIPASLRPSIENTSSLSVWGYPQGGFTRYSSTFWNSQAAILPPSRNPFGLSWNITYEDGCLISLVLSYTYTLQQSSVAYFGEKKDSCIPAGFGAVESTFLINGTEQFPYFYLTGTRFGVVFVAPPSIDLTIL